MKKKTREIMVDGRRYLWRHHCTHRDAPTNPYAYLDRFSAWLEGHGRAPLRVLCVTPGGMNLYEPKWAAAVIRAAVEAGWRPESVARPFEIADGTGFLEQVRDAAAPGATEDADGPAALARAEADEGAR